jgi:hypothetical protein
MDLEAVLVSDFANRFVKTGQDPALGQEGSRHHQQTQITLCFVGPFIYT